jgi:hypothetical protein
VGRPQEIDDFVIALGELTDMGVCDLKVYSDLDRLWRMVDRYKMTAPLSISVVDTKEACVRAICGNRHQATGWRLTDETSSMVHEGESKFPLTIRVQDARGNILKMRLVART